MAAATDAGSVAVVRTSGEDVTPVRSLILF